MKNLINYYYGIIVEKVKKNKDNFLLIDSKNKYMFVPYINSKEKLEEIYLFLIRNNIYCHEILINKNNNIITNYNEKPYILLKKKELINNRILLEDIINYDIRINRRDKIYWKDLWERKIDYLEYQMNEFYFKYPKLKKYFNYYIGLSENAISLLNYVSDFEFNYYIVHKRILSGYTIDDIINPINITFDNITRDIASYIKSNYFYDNIDELEAINIISNINFEENEAILFFSRLLYPSYFFDRYDKIINEDIREDDIEFIIKKSDQFETLLKKIYSILLSKYYIPRIEWLETN